jgi:hypothetical protein
MEKKDQILRSLSKTKLNVNGKNSDFEMIARKRKAKKERKKKEDQILRSLSKTKLNVNGKKFRF